MKIEKSKYQGYLWYSDKSTPQPINNEEFELEIADDENPFIIEGQLYDENRKKSISIKYVDGKYLFKEYDMVKQNGVEMTEQVFYSHRMDGRQLKFNQYWRPEKDDQCCDMNVLQPAELVFVGFNDKEE